MASSGDTGFVEGQNVSLEEKVSLLDESTPAANSTSALSILLAGVAKILTLVGNVLSIFFILLPRRGRPANPKAPGQLHPMAYLDALRGYFALMIYHVHFTHRTWRWMPDWVVKTPGLQFPFRGSSSALVGFFFISGYVTTYKAVGLIHAKQYDKLLDVLASSVWRRYLRLFTPVVGTTFVTFLMIKPGLIILPGFKRRLIDNNMIIVFFRDIVDGCNPFIHVTGWRLEPPRGQILDHFWSIRTEFRSSMMLTLICIGTCRLTATNRKRFLWVGIIGAIYWQSSYAAMAMLGMWFGERRRERMRQQDTLPSIADPIVAAKDTSSGMNGTIDHDQASQLSMQEKVASYASAGFKTLGNSYSSIHSRAKIPPKFQQPLLIAMFLYSFVVQYEPFSNQTSPSFPWSFIRSFTPAFWDNRMKIWLQLMIGFSMMLYPLDLLPILQKPLLTPFSQFLGELSFGIYAMQYTVGWVIWPRYQNYIRTRTSYGTENFDLFVPVFPGLFAMCIVLIWAADLFRRCDMMVVKLCAKSEKRFFTSK